MSSPTFDDFDDDADDDDEDNSVDAANTGTGDRRSVLPKQATQVLKAWLFRHLMVCR